jgi:hypothetical protein
MKDVIKLFYKSIVWDYYRQNTLFILVVILLGFGFLSGAEHQAIIKSALQNPPILAYIFLLWLFHSLKTIFFVLRRFSEKKFRFLFAINLLNFWPRILVLIFLQFLLVQLTFLYALLMLNFAISWQYYSQALWILLFNIFMVVFGALVFENRLNKLPEKKLLINFTFLKFKRIPSPFILFFHKYLINKQPILFLSSKVFSILTLVFAIWIYPTDDYDARLFSIIAVIIVASHLKIASDLISFESDNLKFYRNLPFSNWTRMLFLIAIYLILVLPEFFILIVNIPSDIPIIYGMEWLMLVISLIFFTHNLNYVVHLSEDFKMKSYFFGSIAIILILLSHFSLIFLSIIFLFWASYLFFKNYPTFEMHD